MNVEKIKSYLLCESGVLSVDEAIQQSPQKAGYYSIWIDTPDSLPEPFATELKTRGNNLLYVGIASKSLYSRLIEQELRHKKPATFFRSLGAVLNYKPPMGSLANKRNQNNYRFSHADTQEIKEWIKDHLRVLYVECDSIELNFEKSIIEESTPLFNSSHNPQKSERLSALRSECREIARAI